MCLLLDKRAALLTVSVHAGSLTEATSVTFSREGRPESASSTADRQQKDVSLGSFVMQPHDAIVGRTELFEAVEVSCSVSDIALVRLVHAEVFAAVHLSWSCLQAESHFGPLRNSTLRKQRKQIGSHLNAMVERRICPNLPFRSIKDLGVCKNRRCITFTLYNCASTLG